MSRRCDSAVCLIKLLSIVGFNELESENEKARRRARLEKV